MDTKEGRIRKEENSKMGKANLFPFLFAEKLPAVLIEGSYDEKMQMSDTATALMGTTTSVETGTGGHGDTDSDTDQD
jgi:hypothetical protein